MYSIKYIHNFYKKNRFAFFLGSTWLILANGCVLFSVKYFKNFENRHSYIYDATEILKLHLNYSNKDSLKLIKKRGNIDSSNKRAKSELVFLFNGDKIILSINAINVEDTEKENSENGYDDESKDISSYLENPFLIKKEIKNIFFKMKSFILPFVSSSGNKKTNSEKKSEMLNGTNEITDKKEKILTILKNGYIWKINNVLLVKKKSNDDDTNTLSLNYHFFSTFFNYYYDVIPIYGNPVHNSYYYKYENKRKTFSNTQKKLEKVMLCACLASAVLSIKRIYIYKNSYSSLNFVKHFVCNNKQLSKILGNNQIQILSISGIHEKNYLNSKVFFQAKEKQGVIQLTATKNSLDKNFFLLHAKLLHNNEVIELSQN